MSPTYQPTWYEIGANYRAPANPPSWVDMGVWVATICFNTIEAKKLVTSNAARRGWARQRIGLSWLRQKRMVSICESLTNSAIFDGLLVRLKLSRVVIVEIAVIK